LLYLFPREKEKKMMARCLFGKDVTTLEKIKKCYKVEVTHESDHTPTAISQ